MAPCRVLVLGAHPDDAEVFAGGLLVRHANLGSVVRIVSVTDGSSGHQNMTPEHLRDVRREEARQAGLTIGAEYETLHFRDGYLEPSLALREAIVGEIRSFSPDLVLTHRTNDYHPDHRAVGQAVQDASYMVTVPNVFPDTPAIAKDPVVSSMCDLFTQPNRLRPDIILNVQDEFEQVVNMAACHQSQFFDWLPFHDGVLATVPTSESDRLKWLAGRLREFMQPRVKFFSDALAENCDHTVEPESLIEVYEISEYAAQPNAAERERLFPRAINA
ncbi:MAG: PIG-L deacetylase family protein [Pirellulaceae bacterium]